MFTGMDWKNQKFLIWILAANELDVGVRLQTGASVHLCQGGNYDKDVQIAWIMFC